MDEKKLLIRYIALLGIVPVVLIPFVMVLLMAADVFVSSFVGMFLGNLIGKLLGIILLVVPVGVTFWLLKQISLHLVNFQNSVTRYKYLAYALGVQFIILLAVELIPSLIQGKSVVTMIGSSVFSNIIFLGFTGFAYYQAVKSREKLSTASQDFTPEKK